MEKDLEILDLEEDTQEPKQESKIEPKKKSETKKTSWKKELFSWAMYFLAAIVIAMILKTYVIINATVPTGSMENTILPGDDLLGFRLAYTFSEPERGDIIIFNYPDDESQKYIKRIIGLPGEKITILDSKIYVNGDWVALEEPYLKEAWTNANGPYIFEVPKDCYLVLGDNRNDSEDSRYWEHPYVSKEDIIGKAFFTYYPFNRMGTLE